MSSECREASTWEQLQLSRHSEVWEGRTRHEKKNHANDPLHFIRLFSMHYFQSFLRQRLAFTSFSDNDGGGKKKKGKKKKRKSTMGEVEWEMLYSGARWERLQHNTSSQVIYCKRENYTSWREGFWAWRPLYPPSITIKVRLIRPLDPKRLEWSRLAGQPWKTAAVWSGTWE